MLHSIIKSFILAFYSFCSFFSFGQKNYYIPIRGENQEKLIKVDSLSFKEKYLSSEYYIDSITQKPYTGKAVVYYGENARDSLRLTDGVKNGWQKLYFISENQFRLGKVEYYDQSNYAYISHLRNRSSKSKYSSFARYSGDNAYYFFEIIFKSSGKIIVKQSTQISTGTSKEKFKFSNVVELSEFLRQHPTVYDYCKQAGFFGNPELK